MKQLLVLALLACGACASSQVLNNVESVEYDPVNHRFLASNGGNVIIVDGNGNEVDYLGTDPEADFGMEVMNGVLYTIVDADVRGYDAATGEALMSVTVPDASFLNGMASDGDHRLWVTDFGAKKIYELDVADLANPVLTEAVANTISTPNGIVHDAALNRLVFVSWGGSSAIRAVDLDTYGLSTLLTTGLGNCDGIDNDLAGHFYVSSWNPTRITKFSGEFTADEIITVPGLSSPADLCYAEEIDTLAIPNSGSNTIAFVGFGTSTGMPEPAADALALSLSSNPVDEHTAVRFTLAHPKPVVLEIIDSTGKRVHLLLDETAMAGRHTVALAGINLAAGPYLMRLTSGGYAVTVPFVAAGQ